MEEYIERNAAIANLEDLPERGELDYLGVFDAIKFTPAADVAPVRHGEWMEIWGGPWVLGYECSICNYYNEKTPTHLEPTHYCPNCGAKMDGGSKNGTV